MEQITHKEVTEDGVTPPVSPKVKATEEGKSGVSPSGVVADVVDDERNSDDAYSDAPETVTISPPARSPARDSTSASTIDSVVESSTDTTEQSRPASPKVQIAERMNNTIPLQIGEEQRRMSRSSSLDEVSLIDELPPPAKESPAVTTAAAAAESTSTSILTRFSRSSTSSSQSATASNTITGTPKAAESTNDTTPTQTPNLAAQQQQQQDKSTPPPPPPPPVRRSPFSWLTRSSAPKTDAPPPVVPTPQTVVKAEVPKSRRATESSIVSNSSAATSSTAHNSELLLARFEANKENMKRADSYEKEEASRGMDSLKENFLKIREREVNGEHQPPAMSRSESMLSALGLGTTPPATAAGDTATPAVVDDAAVDWDLWQSVVEDPYKVASTMPTELNHAIQCGIPQTIRGTVWQSLAQSKSQELESIYQEVVALPSTATAVEARALFGIYWPPTSTSLSHSSHHSPGSSASGSPRVGSPKATAAKTALWSGEWTKKTVGQLEKVIKRDLGERTSFGKYKVDQKALLNICKAYALFDPEVGYTQGMTFIATPLLLNMPEQEAFCLFVKLMCKYNLRSQFQENMKGLELRLYQFDRLLEDLEPRLWVHLKRQNIEPSLYAAQWFLTLFTYKFPLQLVLRVFDLVFSEGAEGAVLKFGFVLMRKNADALLEKDFESLGPFLKERLFDVYLDASPSASMVKEAGFFGNGGEKEIYRANNLVQDACGIKLTAETLTKYEAEWTDLERTKRAQELETETLKSNNAQLTLKVKKLEEELELLNKEHVDLLNGMVVKNMENVHLADENTQLVQQVEELKATVEKLPMEVEERYKGELERLMARQLEVHTENQQLEDQMVEMEKELVDTKMKLAEISANHDLLQRKWNDLKKAMVND